MSRKALSGSSSIGVNGELLNFRQRHARQAVGTQVVKGIVPFARRIGNLLVHIHFYAI